MILPLSIAVMSQCFLDNTERILKGALVQYAYCLGKKKICAVIFFFLVSTLISLFEEDKVVSLDGFRTRFLALSEVPIKLMIGIPQTSMCNWFTKFDRRHDSLRFPMILAISYITVNLTLFKGSWRIHLSCVTTDVSVASCMVSVVFVIFAILLSRIETVWERNCSCILLMWLHGTKIEQLERGSVKRLQERWIQRMSNAFIVFFHEKKGWNLTVVAVQSNVTAGMTETSATIRTWRGKGIRQGAQINSFRVRSYCLIVNL